LVALWAEVDVLERMQMDIVHHGRVGRSIRSALLATTFIGVHVGRRAPAPRLEWTSDDDAAMETFRSGSLQHARTMASGPLVDPTDRVPNSSAPAAYFHCDDAPSDELRDRSTNAIPADGEVSATLRAVWIAVVGQSSGQGHRPDRVGFDPHPRRWGQYFFRNPRA